jgi:uncharacterized membrane protein
MAAFRKGPLPPPAELEKYEGLYPGATKLLFDNFITQSNHRMELETFTIQRDAKRADRGQIIAAILCIMVLAPSIVLLFLGKPIIGLSAIIGSLVTLSGIFFGSLFSRRKERENKEKAMMWRPLPASGREKDHPV